MRENRIIFLAENMDRLSRRDRIFLNNPVIMQGLGLALVVIPATNLQNAWMLAVGMALLLTPTRIIATFIGQRIGKHLRGPVYALVSGLVYIGVAMLMENIFGNNLQNVGIYLPLMVLEPLIIKRYASPASERIITSFKKGIITTIGFCLVLFLTAGLRELLALGTLYGVEIYQGSLLPMATSPAGGFILLAFLVALWRGLVKAFKKNILMGVRQIS